MITHLMIQEIRGSWALQFSLYLRGMISLVQWLRTAGHARRFSQQKVSLNHGNLRILHQDPVLACSGSRWRM